MSIKIEYLGGKNPWLDIVIKSNLMSDFKKEKKLIIRIYLAIVI